RADSHWWKAQTLQLLSDASQRPLEVEVDVVGQRLERRDVHYLSGVRQFSAGGQPLTHQLIDRGEKRGERLARTGRRRHQSRAPAANRRPSRHLRRRRPGKSTAKPGLHRWMKANQRVGKIRY